MEGRAVLSLQTKMAQVVSSRSRSSSSAGTAEAITDCQQAGSTVFCSSVGVDTLALPPPVVGVVLEVAAVLAVAVLVAVALVAAAVVAAVELLVGAIGTARILSSTANTAGVSSFVTCAVSKGGGELSADSQWK